MGRIDENNLTYSRLCQILEQHCFDNDMGMSISKDGRTIKISLTNNISNPNASQSNSNQRTSSFDDDVRLVQSQTDCSEEEAIDALNRHNGDIVDAIMHLSIY